MFYITSEERLENSSESTGNNMSKNTSKFTQQESMNIFKVLNLLFHRAKTNVLHLDASISVEDDTFRILRFTVQRNVGVSNGFTVTRNVNDTAYDIIFYDDRGEYEIMSYKYGLNLSESERTEILQVVSLLCMMTLENLAKDDNDYELDLEYQYFSLLAAQKKMMLTGL